MATLIGSPFRWARRHPAWAAFVGMAGLNVVLVICVVVLYTRYHALQADHLRREFEKTAYTEKVREMTAAKLLEAQEFQAGQRWSEAAAALEAAQAALDVQPDLLDEDIREEIKKRQAAVREHLTNNLQKLAVQERLRKFRAAYDDCLFYQTAFTGLDQAGQHQKTREAAREALRLHGLDGEQNPNQGEGKLPDEDCLHLSAGEVAGLASMCYEVLLILAEIEATSPPGEPEPAGQIRQRAEKALSLLERAVRLGKVYQLDSQLYHRHKNRYEQQRQRGKIDQALDPLRQTEKYRQLEERFGR